MATLDSPGLGGGDREAARVAVVRDVLAVDVGVDGVIGEVVGLAARLLGAPMAAVSLIDDEWIWFIATHGFSLDDPPRVGRGDGLCVSVLTEEVPMVLADARTDAATANRALVRQLDIGFYVCVPLITSAGHRVGAVTVMDTTARWEPADRLAMVTDIAALVVKQLESAAAAGVTAAGERELLASAEAGREAARLDRDTAQSGRRDAERDRDQARQGREVARLDRDAARADRDEAVRDRVSAERDRDLVEAYAAVLQSTLLPPMLPTIEGATLGAHYRAASARQVGGDFYDVFPLGGGRWGFFLGDVEGHGVHAAVATSLIRYTLRSAMLHHHDLTVVLGELNAAMLRELAPRRFCTVLIGVLTPDADGSGFLVTLATGGHQPALLMGSPNQGVWQVRPSGGMLVGLRAETSFSSCSVRLRPGQTLVLFTDGIVEARRGEDPFDVEALADFTSRRASLTAGELIADIATLVAKLDPGDDVAVVAIAAWPQSHPCP